jgi:hypothetical protein
MALLGKTGFGRKKNYMDTDVFSSYTYNRVQNFAVMYDQEEPRSSVNAELLCYGILALMVTMGVFTVVWRHGESSEISGIRLILGFVSPIVFFLGAVGLVATLNAVHSAKLLDLHRVENRNTLADMYNLIDATFVELNMPKDEFVTNLQKILNARATDVFSTMYVYQRSDWTIRQLVLNREGLANATKFALEESDVDEPRLTTVVGSDGEPQRLVASIWHERLRLGFVLTRDMTVMHQRLEDDANGLWRFGLSSGGALMVVLMLLSPARSAISAPPKPRDNHPVGTNFCFAYGFLVFLPILILNLFGGSCTYAVQSAFSNTTSYYMVHDRFNELNSVLFNIDRVQALAAEYCITRDTAVLNLYQIGRDELLRYPYDGSLLSFLPPLIKQWLQSWDATVSLRGQVQYFDNSVPSRFKELDPSSDLEIAEIDGIQARIQSSQTMTDEKRATLLIQINLLRAAVLENEIICTLYAITGNTSYYKPRKAALDAIIEPIRATLSSINELTFYVNRMKKAAQQYQAAMTSLNDMRVKLDDQEVTIEMVSDYVKKTIASTELRAYLNDNVTIKTKQANLEISLDADIPYDNYSDIVSFTGATSFVGIVFVCLLVFLAFRQDLIKNSHPSNAGIGKFSTRAGVLWFITCGACIILIALEQYFSRMVITQYQEASAVLKAESIFAQDANLMLRSASNSIKTMYESSVTLDRNVQRNSMVSVALATKYFHSVVPEAPQRSVDVLKKAWESFEAYSSQVQSFLAVASKVQKLQSEASSWNAVNALVSLRVEKMGLDETVINALNKCIPTVTVAGTKEQLLVLHGLFPSARREQLRSLYRSNYTLLQTLRTNITKALGTIGTISLSAQPCVGEVESVYSAWNTMLGNEQNLVQVVTSAYDFNEIQDEADKAKAVFRKALDDLALLSKATTLCKGIKKRCVTGHEDLAAARSIFWIPVFGTWFLVLMCLMMWHVLRETADEWNYHFKPILEEEDQYLLDKSKPSTDEDKHSM